MTVSSDAWLTIPTGVATNNMSYIYVTNSGTSLDVQSNVVTSTQIPSGDIVGAQGAGISEGTGKRIKAKPRHKLGYTDDDRLPVPPKVFFKFIKSKLGEVEQEALKLRLNKLKRLVVSAEDLGQQALFEQLSLQLSIALKEQEAAACGYSRRIPKEVIDRFIKRGMTGKVIKFSTLDKFPRTIPANVAKKIKTCQDTLIFDTFHILFIDYTGEKELKTNKEKIREKDPILFGAFSFAPDTLYYILDWVDPYCDLTLSKLLEEIQIDDPTFELELVPEVDDEYLKSIVTEVKNRHDRLANTKPSNYKDLMVEEDQAKVERKAKRSTIKKDEAPKEVSVTKKETTLDKVKKAVRIPFGKK